MSVCKDNTVQTFSSLINHEYLSILTKKCCDDGVFKIINTLLLSSDNKEQLTYIKKVLLKLQESSLPAEDVVFIIKVLVNVYLACHYKQPAKKALAGCLQTLSKSFQSLVATSLYDQVDATLKSWSDDLSSKDVLLNVEMLSSLMDNFLFGEDCIKQLAVTAYSYLVQSMSVLLSSYSSDRAPVEQNVVMHNCLATTKTTYKLLQKFRSSFEMAAKNMVIHELIKTTSQQLIDNIAFILKKGNFLLDCKTTGSMALSAMLKILAPGQEVSVLLQTVFQCDIAAVPAPDWLINSKLSSCTCSLLPTASYLCLCHGLLTQMEVADLLTEFAPHKYFFSDVLLHEMLSVIPSCTDSAAKRISAETLTLWTSKARIMLKKGDTDRVFRTTLHGSEWVLQRLLGYVWAHWEDTLEALRYSSRLIFEDCVHLHVLASNKSPTDDPYIEDLTIRLLNVSWTSKGKYAPLGSMVGHIGTNKLMLLHPSLAEDVLNQMQEHAITPYASELYVKLCDNHKSELSQPGDEPGVAVDWYHLWVDPVLAVLSGDNTSCKYHVIGYLLPKLFKTNPHCLDYIIQKLQHATGTGLVALITCLRQARVSGLLTAKEEKNNQQAPVEVMEGHQHEPSRRMWCGIVEESILRAALSCCDEQVRLDAFTLLCESNKTGEIFKDQELDLLRFFLALNLNNQGPAFRQYLLTGLKKLLLRVVESSTLMSRDIKKGKSVAMDDAYKQHLKSYRDFLSWLFELLLQSLYPGCVFARRTTCLAALSLMLDILRAKPVSDPSLFCIGSMFTAPHIQTLLECLTDTFEENKRVALKLLSSFGTTVAFMQDPDIQSSLFASAMELASSTKPHDCSTAAFLWKLLLKNESIVTIISFAEHLQSSKDFRDLSVNVSANKDVSFSTRTLLLLHLLLAHLESDVTVAKDNLIHAAATHPMYTKLHCIRQILADVQFSSVVYKAEWRTLLSNIIKVTHTIAEIVSPVIHNSSPEGHIPADVLEGSLRPQLDKLHLNDNDSTSTKDRDADLTEVEQSSRTVTLMPEYLVVCCWRSVKEVSLFLGELSQRAPLQHPDVDGDSGLITCDQLRAIGAYYITQLLESVHRGAFELAYTGFVKLCDMLWMSTVPELRNLPSKWLHEILIDIKTPDSSSRLSVTRRSAGVPFFIQALVSTEPLTSGRVCFKEAMTELLALVEVIDTDDVTNNNPKVHALNILRALFRDKRLGEVVTPYIADGLKAAILGFSSPVWSVRNSATMLLSSMMTRIFGVPRSKEDHLLSKQNCQTGRSFFQRYPSLYPFLLEKLDLATCNTVSSSPVGLHPGLYPVLMVLGRLFPSAMEGTDTNLHLAAFVPHLIRCAASPVFKVRLMAARAVQPLVFRDQLTGILRDLLSYLPVDSNSLSMPQSNLHGLLLQIQHLFVVAAPLPDALLSEMKEVILPHVLSKLWLITRQNPCLVTRKAMCEILQTLLEIKWPSSSLSVLGMIKASLLEVAITEIQIANGYPRYTPGLFEFLQIIATIYFTALDHDWMVCDRVTSKFGQLQEGEIIDSKLMKEELLLSLLNSEFYELRILTLKWINKKQQQRSEENAIDNSGKGYNSEAIFECLVDRAMEKEYHPECIAKVYVCLSSHQMSLQATWKCGEQSFTITEIFEKLITAIQQSNRDEVLCAAIGLTSRLLPALLQVDGPEILTMIQVWCAELQRCSQSDQSTELQTACVHVLLENTSQLLQDSGEKLGTQMFAFWDIVINLLQEEDIEVKDKMAGLLTRLDKTQDAVHSWFALDQLIGRMIELLGSRQPIGCFRTLIKWILGERKEKVVQGERLFYKGEVNCYYEDVVLAGLAANHLSDLLKAVFYRPIRTSESGDTGDAPTTDEQNDSDNLTKASNSKISDGFWCVPSSSHNVVIISDVRQELEAGIDILLEELQEKMRTLAPVTNESPFQRTFLYHDDVAEFYKCLVFVNCLKKLSLSANLIQKCDTINHIVRSKFPGECKILLLAQFMKI